MAARYDIAWKPNPGPQTWALQRKEKEILYGGARGGGKSDAGRAWLIKPPHIRHSGYQGLAIRKNAVDLAEWIEKARVFYRPLGAKIAGNPPVIRFPTGAKIWTGHLKDASSYEKYQGWELHKILIEELTQIPRESDYEKLISSNRSTIVGLDAQIFCTANPGGPGHVWVKGRWVDVARMATYVVNPDDPPEQRITRIFIPAKMEDNPVLMERDPAYVAQISNIADIKLRKAWRDGDWDVFSGQFFDMWDRNVHVVKPFAIPRGWAKYRGLDWGYTAQAAVPWIAVNYEGNHYIYREFYQAGNVPRVLAQKILGMTPAEEKIIQTLADPSIWAKNQYGVGEAKEQFTTKSIQQLFMEEGLYCTKANNDRISGWNNMRELLSWDANRKPRLFVFDTCTETIRTLPSLVHDENNIEDVNTEGEDHLEDAIRYCLNHTVAAHRPSRELSEQERFIEKITSGGDDRREWDNL